MPFKDPEQKKNYQKEYNKKYQKTPKYKAKRKKYDAEKYSAQKQKCNNWSKNYHAKHKDEIHTRKQRKFHERRNEIIRLLGSKCSRCGFSKDVRVLQIDHINGGGTEERKKVNCYERYLILVLESIKRGEKKYQLLCANCNWIKRYEKKELFVNANRII